MLSNPIEIEKNTKVTLARLIYKRCSSYFKNPIHRREFEKWYFKKYGKPYEWKIRS